MAYVRKYRPRTNNKKKVYKKKSNYPKKSYRNLPARMRVNKQRYFINKQIGSMLSKFSETKIIACKNQDQITPVAIQTGAQAYFTAFNIGLNPTDSNFNPIGGIQITQGVDADNRVGDYVYLRKTHITLKVEMINANTVTPTQFRIIVFKGRRSNNPYFTSPSAQSTLFLQPDGLKAGHITSGLTGLDLMMLPLNKRDWVIKFDKRFTMQNYNQLSQSTAIYNHYPCFKDFKMNLPYYAKTKYGGSNNLPIDLDYRWNIIIYSHNVSRETSSEDFECTLRGTTTYQDN